MKNKKLLGLSSFIILLFSSEAFAKTQGNYIGLDVLGTRAVSEYRYGDGSKPDPKLKSNDLGGGLNYKYAVNFHDFFFAPGIFGEINNSRSSLTRLGNGAISQNEKLRIRNRYGLKADIGYDITDGVAFYLTGGVSKLHYRYRFKNAASVGYAVSGQENAYFYGAGLKFELSKNVALNLEYNFQPTRIRPRPNGQTVNIGDEYVTDLQVAKLGISYRF